MVSGLRYLNPFRKPDFVIGRESNPYLRRWWIIPQNRFFNIYLHNFRRSDDDRALHDHPWWSVSIILRSGYIEHLPGGVARYRKPGCITWRKANQAHRVELYRQGYTICSCDNCKKPRPAWTIFITGPRVREWGFHCDRGWIHNRDFFGIPRDQQPKGGEIGPGCGV